VIEIRVKHEAAGAARAADLFSGGAGFDAVLQQWGARYLGFTRRRFVTYSQGGGDWKPLAESTIKARRSGRVAGLGKLKGVKRKAGAVREVRKRVAKGVLDIFSGHAIETAILGNAAILRDTSVLLNALSPGTPGNLLETHPGELRVRCGFAPTLHASGGGATIQQIAGYHNSGGGRLPQRVIFAVPDDATVAAMMGDLSRALGGAAVTGEASQ
jgi:hypothetical protein